MTSRLFIYQHFSIKLHRCLKQCLDCLQILEKSISILRSWSSAKADMPDWRSACYACGIVENILVQEVQHSIAAGAQTVTSENTAKERCLRANIVASLQQMMESKDRGALAVTLLCSVCSLPDPK